MALKKYKPNTPGTRGLTLIQKKGLWTGKPLKSLTTGISKKGGRNNTGRITMRRKGGGHKVKYRVIDFKRNKKDIEAEVQRMQDQLQQAPTELQKTAAVKSVAPIHVERQNPIGQGNVATALLKLDGDTSWLLNDSSPP